MATKRYRERTKEMRRLKWQSLWSALRRVQIIGIDCIVKKCGYIQTAECISCDFCYKGHCLFLDMAHYTDKFKEHSMPYWKNAHKQPTGGTNGKQT